MKQLNKQAVFGWVLSVFAASLFFPFKLPSLIMVAAFVLLLSWSSHDDWRNLRRNLSMIHWGLISFFLVCVATALIYEKLGEAWKLIEMRLAFFFFPVIFALQRDKLLNQALMRNVTWGFIVGALIFTGYNFVVAAINSLHFWDGNWYFDAAVVKGNGFFESISYGGNYFFSVHLSPNLHPTYASIYIINSMLLLWYVERKNRSIRTMDILISAWLGVSLFALSSRGAILSFVLLALFIGGWNAVSDKGRRVKIGLLVLIILVLGGITLNPRIWMMLDPAELTEHNPRYYIWQAAWGLTTDHSWLGLGFSGLKDALVREYEAINYQQGYLNGYNVHNQYLETALTSGLLGLASLLFFLFATLKAGIRSKSPLLLGLVIVIAVNLFFECLLNRFSGIVFVSFLFPFLSPQFKARLAE